MSAAPKRSHEEVSHSSSSTRHPPHEEGGSHPNMTFNIGQDSQIGKVSRSEPHDMDRRSPLHSVYEVPSPSMSNSHFNHLVEGPENRLDSRGPMEGRDSKVDNRDARAEPKEPHHSSKTEKDVRAEARGDDNKEMRYERETPNDPKSVLKLEKDCSDATKSQSNWKEHLKGKRYPDIPIVIGGSDSWGNVCRNVYGPLNAGKEGFNNENRRIDSREGVGENKLPSKGDEKYLDKVRKKKEGKHREWGERDKDSVDRKSNLLTCSTGNDSKEPSREEREAEKSEKESKYILKDQESPNERQKDNVNRDALNTVEKEGSYSEKEMVDCPPEPRNLALEQMRTKEIDGWKNIEKEAGQKRKERDSDLEAQRIEKRSRLNEKESDEGGANIEKGAERDNDVLSYGVQKCRRMLHPRDSPEHANRFSSRNQDVDVSQETVNRLTGRRTNETMLTSSLNQSHIKIIKAEVSSVVYRVSECMQELIKLWKEYESPRAGKNGEYAHEGPNLVIRIPAAHVTATNRQVRGGQLWGTDIYTNDSDIVAVLMHMGYCRPTAMAPPSAIEELCATVQMLPPQESYVSTFRNNVRSRAWGAAIGCSYRVEHCCIVKKGGGTIDLEPCLTLSSTIEPTLVPVAVERTMTTRAAALNALRQQRFVREVTIQYNLCNEPWIKYGISIVADKGLKKSLYTSARLKKGEVLYLETHSCRYELCFAGEKAVKTSTAPQRSDVEKPHNNSTHHMNGDKSITESGNCVMDVFRWSKCKKPLPQKVIRTFGVPLPLEHVEVLVDNLDWEDVLWSQTGVWIAGKEYHLARVHFLSSN